MRSLVIIYSYHHENTLKVAKAIAGVLDAEIMKPDQIRKEELSEYDLIGFGSGIYDATLHTSVLDIARNLPENSRSNTFIFSTTGVPKIGFSNEFVRNNHSQIRTILESKGCKIIDEFGCLGHNTNSFLRFTKGLNRGRPNKEDLRNAEEFALRLKKEVSS